MPRDLIRRGLAHLADALVAHASTPVAYVRGAETVADLPMTLASKLLRIDDGAGGVLMEWTDLTGHFPASALVLGGVVAEPARGDLILVPEEPDDPANPRRLVYEVAPVGSEPPWRYEDPYRTLVRVHAKFLGVEGEC